jgi:hypothetical protein
LVLSGGISPPLAPKGQSSVPSEPQIVVAISTSPMIPGCP